MSYQFTVDEWMAYTISTKFISKCFIITNYFVRLKYLMRYVIFSIYFS